MRNLPSLMQKALSSTLVQLKVNSVYVYLIFIAKKALANDGEWLAVIFLI